MNFANSIIDRVLSSMTGRTCENVVGAEARHILQDVTPGLAQQVDESDIHRQTIGGSPAGKVCLIAGQNISNSRVKWDSNSNNPKLVNAEYIVIPPRPKAEEMWFFGEQNNHVPARVLSLTPPSKGILKMPKGQNHGKPSRYVFNCFNECYFILHATKLTHAIKQSCSAFEKRSSTTSC